jgi:hypothetical protein
MRDPKFSSYVFQGRAFRTAPDLVRHEVKTMLVLRKRSFDVPEIVAPQDQYRGHFLQRGEENTA